MVWHVYERARAARRIDRVVVATDDERIVATVERLGGQAVMTSSRCSTGTDRVAEAAQKIEAEIVVNVQGDEPMLDPAGLDAAIEPMLADASIDISTLSLPLTDVDEMMSPSVVKVVTDGRHRALYFSRSPIPFVRDSGKTLRDSAAAAVAQGLTRKHVGLYAFRRAALLRFAALPPTRLEKAESLEQLRAMENGMSIGVVPVDGEAGVAVDTPQDLERVRALMSGARAQGRLS
jgi:3-deoxy-manno-octulosonate cytidylyltransferase (CMP-KDO synthetase)